MPAKDVNHEIVKTALQKDGWTITHDPYHLAWRGRDMFIDLGAEMIAAECGDVCIAVEVKSFTAKSEITELERALGQFVLYEKVLKHRDPRRLLFLAVPHRILSGLFVESFGDVLLMDSSLRIFGYDVGTIEVTTWLPNRP
jgi:hypothetical protein